MKNEKDNEDEENENINYNSASVIKFTATGEIAWKHMSNIFWAHDMSNAVVQLPNGGDLVYAGYANVDGVNKRTLTKISLADGTILWGARWAGDTASLHSAWEFAALSDDGTKVLLAGVQESTSVNEFNFKSFGNVATGNAIVQQIPVSALLAASAPTVSVVEWTYKNANVYTAKKAAPLPGGGCIVAMLGEDGIAQTTVVRLSSTGSIVVRAQSAISMLPCPSNGQPFS